MSTQFFKCQTHLWTIKAEMPIDPTKIFKENKKKKHFHWANYLLRAGIDDYVEKRDIMIKISSAAVMMLPWCACVFVCVWVTAMMICQNHMLLIEMIRTSRLDPWFRFRVRHINPNRIPCSSHVSLLSFSHVFVQWFSLSFKKCEQCSSSYIFCFLSLLRSGG